MRIVVTSDTHRNSRDFFNIIDRHIENANLFVNLGDSQNEIELAEITRPELKIECVAGNCDFGSTLPLYKMIKFNGKRVLITHGHTFYVKHGYQKLQEFAKQENADIVLFGHTHIPYTEYINGIYYMNPGAVCSSSYGIVDIEKNGVMIYTNKI